MASGDIVLTGTINTSSSEDVYPTHTASTGKGGYRTVQSIEERNVIPAERREVGMQVYVVDENKVYILEDDILNDNWAENSVTFPDGLTGQVLTKTDTGVSFENVSATINPRGDYSIDASPYYQKGDYVTFTDGVTYVCKKSNPNNIAPTNGNENDEFWQVLILAGTQGPQGEKGDPPIIEFTGITTLEPTEQASAVWSETED